MFRTAESFGVEKIWLSPLCADPHHPRAERTAMGCVDALDWERLPADPCSEFKSIQNSDPNSALNPEFIKGPFFALETGGIPLAEFLFPKKGIMIVGSEELGVSPQALALADASLGRVSIPTFGAKGSLNASVAFGIAIQAYAAKLSSS
jgi:TrmH family RNA methyltransferase